MNQENLRGIMRGIALASVTLMAFGPAGRAEGIDPLLSLDLNPPPAEFQNTQAHGISVGASHACALTQGGGVRCWGSGIHGQLGYGNTLPVGINNTPTLKGNVHIGANRTALQVVTGDGFTCALLDTRDVRCWGDNAYGQLGLGHTNDVGDNELPDSQPAVNFHGFNPTKLAAGGNHACALFDDKSVRCWGRNDSGQLGLGHFNNIGDSESESIISGKALGILAKDITAGRDHTCAITTAGFATCWGENAGGQLGRKNTTNLNTPINSTILIADALLGNLTVKQIVAGQLHTCALFTSGKVRCWGDNGWGALGYGNTNVIGDNEYPSSAGDVPILAPGESVLSLSENATANGTCAIIEAFNDVGTALHSFRCWGSNIFGSFGYGHTNRLGDDEPASAGGNISHGIIGAEPVRVSIGAFFMCAGFSNGKIKCAGHDDGGGMGDGQGANNIGDNETMAIGLTVK